nr:hypothetical protein Iba_chr02eCG1340 [Ipomoea batatas]
MTSGGGGWSEVEKGGCEVELISIWKLMICLRSSSGGEAAGWWRKEYGCNPGGGQTRTWEETAADGGKEGEDKTALLKNSEILKILREKVMEDGVPRKDVVLNFETGGICNDKKMVMSSFGFYGGVGS